MALQMMRLVVCGIILAIFGIGLYDFLKNIESNGCEMTYMFQNPQYLPVPLGPNITARYPRYKLYLYAEGRYAAESRGMKLKGIPVLFIPGNAGSYKQVRSLGSVALTKAEDSNSPFHFNYFSIDFNEELSGLFGGFLRGQTKFAALCVKHILTLYKDAPTVPKTVVLVGHSMGGMVSRALYTVPRFNPKLVHTIITQATPHQAPVISLDSHLQKFYEDVNSYWARHHNTTLKEVTVVSTGGGFRDHLVRSHLTKLDRIVDEENAVTSNTMTVPRAFVSTDHLCHVWCKQVVLATKRALFNAVEKKSKQIAAGPSYRHGVFSHHLVDNPGPRVFKGVYDDVIHLEQGVKWEIRKKNSWATHKDSLSTTRHSVVAVPQYKIDEYAYVAVANIDNTAWLGVCTPQMAGKGKKQKKEEKCRTVTNFAQTASMIPPYRAERKAVHIPPEELEEEEYVVAVLPKTDSKLEITAELYRVSARHLEYNVTDLLAFILGIPQSIASFEVVIPRTDSGAVFYNITLRGLSVPLQAYAAYINCEECKSATTDSTVVAKLHVPWANEDTYTTIPADENGTVSLKLQSGRPDNLEEDVHPELHFYLHPGCTYRVSIALSWSELYGQLVRYYGTMLPAFLVINVLMALAYQLKQLDEQGLVPDIVTAHAQYGQPWRVVPMALILRFMLYFPEELPLADRLYVPPDDSSALRKMNVWYAALPVILFMIANGIVCFYTLFITFNMAVLGRIFGLILGKCCLSVRFVQTASVLEFILYAACIPLAYYVCGTLAVCVVYFIFIIKCLWSYVVAKFSGIKERSVWNTHNAYVTLLVLMLMLVTINGPTLIVWGKNLQDGVLTLESDPSQHTGIAMALVAMLLSAGKFPRISNEIFGAIATIVHVCAVFMVLFCMTSLYRVSYYVISVLFLIGFSSTILNYYANTIEPAPVITEKDAAATAVDQNGAKEIKGHGDKHSEEVTEDDDLSNSSDSASGREVPTIKSRLRKKKI